MFSAQLSRHGEQPASAHLKCPGCPLLLEIPRLYQLLLPVPTWCSLFLPWNLLCVLVPHLTGQELVSALTSAWGTPGPGRLGLSQFCSQVAGASGPCVAQGSGNSIFRASRLGCPEGEPAPTPPLISVVPDAPGGHGSCYPLIHPRGHLGNPALLMGPRLQLKLALILPT